MKIEIKKDLQGSILDVGGGGECVIGQIYGRQVIAIDRLQEELDEAPDCCAKRVMDAADLSFPDHSFDNVTFFYSLMYMGNAVQERAIREAWRVLRPGGKLHIWDCDIRSAYPEPHIVELDIVSEALHIHTSYGIVKDEAQDCASVVEHLKRLGRCELHASRHEDQFFIRCEKSLA